MAGCCSPHLGGWLCWMRFQGNQQAAKDVLAGWGCSGDRYGGSWLELESPCVGHVQGTGCFGTRPQRSAVWFCSSFYCHTPDKGVHTPTAGTATAQREE